METTIWWLPVLVANSTVWLYFNANSRASIRFVLIYPFPKLLRAFKKKGQKEKNLHP